MEGSECFSQALPRDSLPGITAQLNSQPSNLKIEKAFCICQSSWAEIHRIKLMIKQESPSQGLHEALLYVCQGHLEAMCHSSLQVVWGSWSWAGLGVQVIGSQT